MSAGSRFQTDGAADRNACSPVNSLVHETWSVLESLDPNERPGT